MPQSKGAVMSKHRMEIFSDGVFAIVITLLILDVRLPDVEHFTLAALSKIAHNIFAFTLSFVIVGMYWVAHHNMALFLKAVAAVHVLDHVITHRASTHLIYKELCGRPWHSLTNAPQRGH